MKAIAEICKRIRLRVHRHVLDFGFDTRKRIETTTIHPTAQLGLPPSSAEHAVHYEPTPTVLFKLVMWRIRKAVDISSSVFVDVGSGKARTLLLAAARSFCRVEGVEVAAPLHQVAQANILKAAPRPGKAPIILHHADATQYQFPSEPLVVYFFNPFDTTIMDRVRWNLVRSLRESPRACLIIYVNAKHRAVFDGDDAWEVVSPNRMQRVLEHVLSPWPIVIYQHRANRPPQHAIEK